MLRPEAGSRRRQGFKKGVDAEEGRRRRENNIVALRKNKRDENLQKKRMVNLDQPAAASEMGDYAYSPTTGLSQKVVGHWVVQPNSSCGVNALVEELSRR